MKNMKLLMENWRNYIDDCNDDIVMTPADLDRVYLIKEGKKVDETSMTVLSERYDRNEIDEDYYANVLIESIKYEHGLLNEVDIMGALKKVAGKVGEKVKPAIAKAQFKARQLLYKTIYGTASKVLKFITGIAKKILARLGEYGKNLIKYKDNPPEPTKAQKLLAKGIKYAKFIGNLLTKVASFLGKIVGTIGNFLGHPVVKNTLLVGCAIITGVAVAAPAVIAGGAMAFVVPFATRRTAFAGAKEVGKAALGKGRYSAGESEEELDAKLAQTSTRRKKRLNEVSGVDLTDEVLQMINSMSTDELGQAMDKIAQEIGQAKLDTSFYDTSIQSTVSVDGVVQDSFSKESFIANSDQNLKNQMSALQTIKDAATRKEAGDVLKGFDDVNRWYGQVNDIIKTALQSAQAHCEADAAACAGANKFIEDINIASTHTVNSETLKWTISSFDEEAGEALSHHIAQDAETHGRYGVTRGGEQGLEDYYDDTTGDNEPRPVTTGGTAVTDTENTPDSIRRGVDYEKGATKDQFDALRDRINNRLQSGEISKGDAAKAIEKARRKLSIR